MKVQSKSHSMMTEKFLSGIRSFQVFFLRDDKSQSVKVVETNRIDLEELKKHLKFGESIFIKPKTHISNTKS